MIFKASDSIFSIVIGMTVFHVNYKDLSTKISKLLQNLLPTK